MTETPDWQGKPEAPTVSAPPPVGTAPYPYSYPPEPYAGGYPPPTYGDYYPGAAPIIRNGLGVASLVVAIIGLLLTITVAGGVVLGIIAIILGFVGLARVKRSEANNRGVALSGVILGVIAIVVGLLFIPLFWFPVFKQVGATDYVDCMQQAGQDSSKAQDCADQLRQSVENHFPQTKAPVR
ncbi:MAG: DUF4190 domain-containing protein [Mycobacterium sp.]